jgi:hypothetical protein
MQIKELIYKYRVIRDSNWIKSRKLKKTNLEKKIKSKINGQPKKNSMFPFFGFSLR